MKPITDTFVRVAPDCPVTAAVVPVAKANGPTVAVIQYELLTARPYLGLVISAGLGVAEIWAGLALAYAAPSMPPSFAIIAVATVAYLAAYGGYRFRRSHGGLARAGHNGFTAAGPAPQGAEPR